MNQTSFPPNAILVTSSGLIGASAAGSASTLSAADARTLLSVYSQAEVAAAFQPLDADLTAIAALTTTTYGRSLLTGADASATRTTLGLGTMATQASTSYLALSGGTLTGNLLFTDATYDIGASGATRPRDLFLSRNATIGGKFAHLGATAASARDFLQWNDFAGSTWTFSTGGSAATGFRITRTGDADKLVFTTTAMVASVSGSFLGSTVITGLSSTSASRSQGQVVGSWVDSTDASRKAQVVESVYDTSARAVTRSFANGTNGYKAFKMATTAPADADLSTSEIVFYDSSGTPGWKFKDSSNTVTSSTFAPLGTIAIRIDGGGSAITTGAKKVMFRVPYACTITGWEIAADTSGSAVLDIWKDSYANYPPTVADTITASAKPTLSAATKAQSSTLTGWTTSLASGDYLEINVDSASSVTVLNLTLTVRRT